MNDENNNQTDGDNDGTDGKKYPLNIDVDLRYSTELTWNHRVIVQMVRVLAGDGREVYITDKGLGKNLGLSTSAISKRCQD